MKKALQITIAGTLFTIEDDAYEKLQAYLHSIQTYFGSYPDSTDIINDIEARIAEQLLEHTKHNKSIVTLTEIEQVMATMGSVEEIREESSTDSSSSEKTTSGSTDENAPRRLFRNPDDVILTGLGSGIAAYFNIDPLIVRLILLVLVPLTSGFIILLYIIFALIIPKAVTAADKVQMRGGPITLNSFKENFSEQIDQIKKNSSEYKEAYSAQNSRLRSFLERMFELMGKIVKALVKIVVAMFGLAITIGPIIGIAAATFAFMNLTFNVHSPYVDFPLAEVISGPLYYLLVSLGFLVVFIPLVFILTMGVSLLARGWKMSTWSAATLGSLWVLSALILGTLLMRVVPEVHQKMATLPEYQESKRTLAVEGLPTVQKFNLDSNEHVEYVQGTSTSIVATGRMTDIDHAKVTIENGTLSIHQIPREKICYFCFGSQQVKFVVTLPSITAVETHGIARFSSDLIRQPNLTLTAEDASSIDIHAITHDIELKTKDIGKIHLTGSSTNSIMNTADASSIDAFGFETSKATITSKDASSVEVHAVNSLDATTKDAAHITYQGSPELKEHKSDAGEIEQAE